MGAGEFRVNVSAASSESGAFAGREASQDPLTGTPFVLSTQDSDVATFRTQPIGIITPTQGFDTVVNSGVHIAGADCAADVLIAPM
jgi:hypothetical protein